jgi:hypothetical protein
MLQAGMSGANRMIVYVFNTPCILCYCVPCRCAAAGLKVQAVMSFHAAGGTHLFCLQG